MRPRMVVLGLAVLSACSSGGAERASSSGEGTPVPTVSPDRELRRVLEEYAACLRQEGIDASAPSFDESLWIIRGR
jgi:hypothetical protein